MSVRSGISRVLEPVPEGQSPGELIADLMQARFTLAMVAANVLPAPLMFLFVAYVLPVPPDVAHPGQLLKLNLAVFVAFAALSLPLGVTWSRRRLAPIRAWVAEERRPDARERELTLRAPLTEQWIHASLWASAAVVFTALNAPFSPELAGNVAITIALGGLLTCAVGYLLAERVLRPIFALSLAGGPPRRPLLPGVAAKVVVSWALGTGVVLLGTALVGIGGLHEQRWTSFRLSITIVVLSGVGLAVGFVAMVWLARSLADPIEEVRHALEEVEEGNLDSEVSVYDGSEVGLLQAGFNRMVAGLRERERLRDLFGRHVGEDVARQALDRGIELGGELRHAAVIFIDVVGSTRLSATQDPREVVHLLNSFFALIVDVVEAHGGWVNKFEGDAALCIFGAPVEDPRPADCALAASCALRARLTRELPEIKAGIGVSAGQVVAGNLGAARRFEYTVIGDPVNEAARLSELAKDREEHLLASGSALAQASADEAARWESDGEVTLRGRTGPTEVLLPAGPR
jgi:adenylate cyclase